MADDAAAADSAAVSAEAPSAGSQQQDLPEATGAVCGPLFLLCMSPPTVRTG